VKSGEACSIMFKLAWRSSEGAYPWRYWLGSGLLQVKYPEI